MSLITHFQDLVAQVPDLIQPLVVAAAGAVPFVEGEGAVVIGVVGGVPLVLAAIAAMTGNFLSVAVAVLLSSGARDAVVSRRAAKIRVREDVLVGGGSAVPDAPVDRTDTHRQAARRAKFQRAYERYGVPGVSLLGPLLLPTQITATLLTASGVGKARILGWQAVAIVGWTTAAAVVVHRVLSALG